METKKLKISSIYLKEVESSNDSLNSENDPKPGLFSIKNRR